VRPQSGVTFRSEASNRHLHNALAVTMGRRLGPLFGGRGQMFVKPSINIGAEWPGNEGAAAGFQLIGS
jgi:hypothetical protein